MSERVDESKWTVGEKMVLVAATLLTAAWAWGIGVTVYTSYLWVKGHFG